MGRATHFVIYEMSLLFGSGISIVESYAAILATHTDPEVVALFTDLKNDWNENDPAGTWKMIEPFAKRKQDADYALAEAYVQIGAMTSMVDVYWKQLALAYVLKRKLLARKVFDAQDALLAEYLLQIFTASEKTYAEISALFASWLASPEWNEAIAGQKTAASTDGSLAFPEGWWETFDTTGVSKTPLPTLSFIQEVAGQSGDVALVTRVIEEWDRYTTSYDSIV